MKGIVKLIVIAVMSALLVVGIMGCGSGASSASSASSASGAAVSSAAESASSASEAGKATTTSTTNSKSASSASQTTSSSSTSPANLGQSQRFGSAKTGYVSVPSDWKDFTSKLDSRVVEASAMTYLVDPTTEFTSSVESHWAYSSSITLETFPCKYTDKADELLYKYRGETDNYTTPDIQKTTFNGKNASVVACSSADNVDITNIAIEKDANSCVLITAWGTRSTDEAVLSYVATWSMDK